MLFPSLIETNNRHHRYIGEKKAKPVAELRRKAKGRNIPKARELLIFDEKGEPRLRHQSKDIPDFFVVR